MLKTAFRSIVVGLALTLVATAIGNSGPLTLSTPGYALVPAVSGMTGAKDIAVNHVGRRIYVATDDGVAFVDALTYTLDTIVPTGLDGQISVDWRRNRLVVGDAVGDVRILEADTGAQVSLQTVGGSVTGATMHSRLGRFFVATASSLVGYDTTTGAPIGIAVTGSIDDLTADPIDDRIYVTGSIPGSISYYSPSPSFSGSFVSSGARTVAVNPNLDRLYVGHQSTEGLSVYRTSDNAFLGSFSTPDNNTIRKVDIDRRRNRVYALGDNVYIFDGSTGSLIAEVNPGASQVFHNLVVNSVTGDVFVSDGDSLLRLVEPAPVPGVEYEPKVVGIMDDTALDPSQIYTIGWSLNDHGQVSGQTLPVATRDGRAYVNDVDGIQYIYGPGGTELFGMNNSGDLVGRHYSSAPAQLPYDMIRGTLSGNLTNLGRFGGNRAVIRDITDWGLMGGFWEPIPNGVFEAFLWDGVTTTFIPGGQILSLNEFGDGAGATRPGGLLHAWAYMSGTGIDIGLLPGADPSGSSTAFAINDFGQITGRSHSASGEEHAFVWDTINGMQDLGVLATSTWGFDINNDGQVVGSESSDSIAVVYDPVNGLRDLNTLVPSGFDYLITAYANNNVGQLTAESATITYVLDPVANQGIASLVLDPQELTGAGTSTGHITLVRPAGPGGELVTLSSDEGAATVQASVLVPEGQFSTTFEITADAVLLDTPVLITAVLGDSAAGSILLLKGPDLGTLTFDPATVVGSFSSTGTITLTQPAPAGGFTIALQSFDPSVSVPPTVSVNEGETSVQFVATTVAVLVDVAALVQATYNETTVDGTLNVRAPRPILLELNPATAPGGTFTEIQVTLDGPAPANYATSLSSDNPNAPTASSISIAEGQTQGGQALTTIPVTTTQTATITAGYLDGTASAILTIQAAELLSNVLNPASVFKGGTSTGTVTLTGNAPTGGATIALSSSSNKVTVPSSVFVPAGSKTATYVASVSTNNPPTSADITATWKTVSKVATLQIKTVELLGMLFQNTAGLTITTARAGATIRLRVTISGPAPTGGARVNLSSSHKKVLPLPAAVTVPAGQTSVTVTISLGSVTTSTLTTATGTYITTKTSNLTVIP